MSTRSATPRVAGLPLCIATPTSARRTGRMSFTPSPVIATFRPRPWSADTSRAFSCGSTRPKTVVRVGDLAQLPRRRASARSRPDATVARHRPAPAAGRSPRRCSGRRRTRSSRRCRARCRPSIVADASGASSSSNVSSASGSSGRRAATGRLAIGQRRVDGPRASEQHPVAGRGQLDGPLGDRLVVRRCAGSSDRRRAEDERSRRPPGAVAVAGREPDRRPAQRRRERAPPRRSGGPRPGSAAARARVVALGASVLAAIAREDRRRPRPRVPLDRLRRAECDPLGRQRAGLVAAERVDPAHRLDRALALGERAEARDPDRRGRVGHGQHQREALRHERDQHGGGEHRLLGRSSPGIARSDQHDDRRAQHDERPRPRRTPSRCPSGAASGRSRRPFASARIRFANVSAPTASTSYRAVPLTTALPGQHLVAGAPCRSRRTRR